MFVTRNQGGEIIGWFRNCQFEGQEEIADDSHELQRVPTLSDLKAEKLEGANNAFEVAARQLTDGYPESEKDSWPDQKNEVVAWRDDPATPTPYLDLLAGYRGIDPLLYRQKTLAKVETYTAVAAYLIGTRQKYADQIADAATAEELNELAFSFQ